MRWTFRFIVFFVTIYVIGCGILYAIQDDILFRPEGLSTASRFNFGSEIWIDVDEDVRLHGLYYREEDSKGVVLYWHGNRGNVRWCQRQASTFAGMGYDVLMVDYRGYGLSSGQISSDEQLHRDAQLVYDFLTKEYKEDQIIVAGYSLGSGLASYLAANNRPQGLVLVAPFVSITDLKDRILPFIPDVLVRFPLDNYHNLLSVKCPTLIFHGTTDEVIPYDSSIQLQKAFKGRVKLVTLDNTGHRGAIFHELVSRELKTFIQGHTG